MIPRPRPARELAARALCRFHGNPEDTTFEGRPMWESYLPEADAVIEAIGRGSEVRQPSPVDGAEARKR